MTIYLIWDNEYPEDKEILIAFFKEEDAIAFEHIRKGPIETLSVF